MCCQLCPCTIFKIYLLSKSSHMGSHRLSSCIFSMFRALFCNLIGKLTVPNILNLYTVISSMFDLSNWRGCCAFTKSFEPRGEVFALVPSLLPKSPSSSLCIPAVWVRLTLTVHCSVLLPHFSFPFHILSPP